MICFLLSSVTIVGEDQLTRLSRIEHQSVWPSFLERAIKYDFASLSTKTNNLSSCWVGDEAIPNSL